MTAVNRSTKALIFVALSACAVVAGENTDRDRTNREDLAALQGKWRIVSFVKDGKEEAAGSVDEIARLGLVFTIKDETLTVTSNGNEIANLKAVLRLDVNFSPKLLDFAESAGAFNDRKRVIEGIYTLEQDSLTWCVNFDGGEPARANRPAALESKVDSGAILIKLERLKE
jgi:uncharacterized protein (TIGR03067 family)